jgi:hypothetical protein
MLLMTTGNLIELGFAFLVAVGLLLLLAGVVLLVRWKTTSAPGAKITVWNIEVENAGPGLLVMLVGLGVIIAGGYFLTQAIEHTQSPTLFRPPVAQPPAPPRSRRPDRRLERSPLPGSPTPGAGRTSPATKGSWRAAPSPRSARTPSGS